MNISYKPLQVNMQEDQLQEIATLIYDTDPFIYPAMFTSREEAQRLIPALIRRGDSMFCRENVYIAQDGNHIRGMILWHRGPLIWADDLYLSLGGKAASIERVRREYFDSYKEIEGDKVAIINLCVQAESRGKGIGHGLLGAFVNQEEGPWELYVLADNDTAIGLYLRHGFHITERLDGFSLEQDKPVCYRMIKEIEARKGGEL